MLHIIYGYNPTGEAVYQELSRQGEKTLIFCEDSLVKRENFDMNVPIYSLDELSEKALSGNFIICIPNFVNVVKKLMAKGVSHYVLAKDFLADASFELFNYKTRKHDFAVREVIACLKEQKSKLDHGLFMRNIDLMVTERCSMKCRDCSNLMQYYKHPVNYDVDEVVGWLNKLTNYVDEIYEVRMIGGEPFMHPSIGEITKRIIDNEKVDCITFYSNGTIFPNKRVWDILGNDKIAFSLTNYGALSVNIEKIINELDRRNICYDVHDGGMWTKCSEIYSKPRDVEKTKKVYSECCAKNLTTILKGRVYKCPFMANAMNLRAIPNMENDYVLLDSLNDFSYDAARDYIRSYFGRDGYKSCSFCPGRSFDAMEIPAALQTKFPIPYDEV